MNEVFLPECSGVKLFIGGAGSNVDDAPSLRKEDLGGTL